MSKSTEQIAKDCGLDEDEALILEKLAKGLSRFRDTDPEAMVLKLYRRIEKLEEERASLGSNLDDLLFCVEDFQLGDYSPLMDEVFDSRNALEQAGIARRREVK